MQDSAATFHYFQMFISFFPSPLLALRFLCPVRPELVRLEMDEGWAGETHLGDLFNEVWTSLEHAEYTLMQLMEQINELL